MRPNEAYTYSLCTGDQNSDNYYDEIASFGEYLIHRMEVAFGQITVRLTGYLEKSGSGPVSSREEYFFEALMIGTLWDSYGGYALGTSKRSAGVMQKIAEYRLRGGNQKKLADLIRAVSAHRLLKRRSHEGLYLFPDAAGLEKLIRWMRATGEYVREAERFTRWLNFFRQESETFTFINLCRIRAFASFFKVEAQKTLGKYTTHVNDFVLRVAEKRHFREDKISVSRKSTEYHLNMVGAYIYNKAMRDDFIRSHRKMIILPVCMKNPQNGPCKAQKGLLGEVCTGCTPGCQVNLIRQSGTNDRLKVEIVGHTSDISLIRNFIPDGYGMVGVGCAPMVISGGLALANYAIPSQCVILDHSGCLHWCKKNVVTTLNLPVLFSTLTDDRGMIQGRSLTDKREKEIIAA